MSKTIRALASAGHPKETLLRDPTSEVILPSWSHLTDFRIEESRGLLCILRDGASLHFLVEASRTKASFAAHSVIQIIHFDDLRGVDLGNHELRHAISLGDLVILLGVVEEHHTDRATIVRINHTSTHIDVMLRGEPRSRSHAPVVPFWDSHCNVRRHDEFPACRNGHGLGGEQVVPRSPRGAPERSDCISGQLLHLQWRALRRTLRARLLDERFQITSHRLNEMRKKP